MARIMLANVVELACRLFLDLGLKESTSCSRVQFVVVATLYTGHQLLYASLNASWLALRWMDADDLCR